MCVCVCVCVCVCESYIGKPIGISILRFLMDLKLSMLRHIPTGTWGHCRDAHVPASCMSVNFLSDLLGHSYKLRPNPSPCRRFQDAVTRRAEPMSGKAGVGTTVAEYVKAAGRNSNLYPTYHKFTTHTHMMHSQYQFQQTPASANKNGGSGVHL